MMPNCGDARTLTLAECLVSAPLARTSAPLDVRHSRVLMEHTALSTRKSADKMAIAKIIITSIINKVIINIYIYISN